MRTPEGKPAKTTASSSPAPNQNRQIGEWFTVLPYIPLFFLGLGVYRAWIEIAFVGSFVDFPTDSFAGQNVFDFVMVITMLLSALFSKRIGSFLNRSVAYWISGTALTLSTAGIFYTCWHPTFAPLLAFPCACLGGFGIAILILIWSELYSCLNPLRVALYYSASLVVAAIIIYLCRGLLLPWLAIIMLLLPAVSLICALASYRSIPTDELPVTRHSSFSFPWKPVLLMAFYGFAFGLREVSLYAMNFGPHSAFGTLVVAALVFVGVLIQGERFDFALIYRVALPLMVGAFLLLPSFGFLSESLSAFCVSASYAAFSILIMLILANMSYRYGISALWLFGFERGIRLLSVFFGRQVEEHASELFRNLGFEPSVFINVLVVLMIVIVSLMLFSEKELSSRWGITFLQGNDAVSTAVLVKKQELAICVSNMARRYNLSQREEEVLLLLAQKKTIVSIERDLFIANGTAKAHVRHIYRKLNIHSRDELFERLEL